jgi:hypothetical protein
MILSKLLSVKYCSKLIALQNTGLYINPQPPHFKWKSGEAARLVFKELPHYPHYYFFIL